MLRYIFSFLIMIVGFNITNAQVALLLDNNSNEDFIVYAEDATGLVLVNNVLLQANTGQYTDTYPVVTYPVSYTVSFPFSCIRSGSSAGPPFGATIPITCTPNANDLHITNTPLTFPPGWSFLSFVAD